MLAAIFRILALVRKELLAMFKDPTGAPSYLSRPCSSASCSAMS